jgi:CubicO group peptidase (beta-lactamase class C family)|tara:strand:- start:702 stop:1850 length:1149 start_codon:yes stop_codon:yes gene_type:complete
MKEINSTNWLQPQNNRKSFQNIRSIFPVISLKKGNDKPSKIIKNLRPIKSIEFEDLDGKKSISDMLKSTYTDAFLVLKGDELIFEEYFNEMNSSSLHLMNSISKSFVGMLAGIFIENGKIDPNKEIPFYIPEFKGTAFSNTTLQHALDMTAAVTFGEDYNDNNADFWHESAVVGWRPDLREKNSSENLFDFALSLKDKDQKDGEKYHYRTVLTNIIVMVIERATDEKFSKLLEKYLWQKLGSEQEALIVKDEAGFPYMGAGMNACARDLARFGLMLLHDGFYNNEQIIPASWIESTKEGSAHLRKIFSESDYGLMFPEGHYKNQLWIANPNTMICLGIYGQTIYVNQLANIVIVKFSSHPQPADNNLYTSILLGMEAIVNEL